MTDKAFVALSLRCLRMDHHTWSVWLHLLLQYFCQEHGYLARNHGGVGGKIHFRFFCTLRECVGIVRIMRAG